MSSRHQAARRAIELSPRLQASASNSEMADAELSALLEQRAQLKIAETVGRKNGRAAAWYEERPAEQRFVGSSTRARRVLPQLARRRCSCCPQVREKVFSFEFDADRHGAAETCVPLQLGVLFARLATSSLHALDTRALTASFGWSQAEAFRQHDVQELLAVLFDALEKYQCDVSSAFSARCGRRCAASCGTSRRAPRRSATCSSTLARAAPSRTRCGATLRGSGWRARARGSASSAARATRPRAARSPSCRRF